jgi:mRNA interferase MazF
VQQSADKSPPDAGDVLWIDFGAPVGREQGGRRPALVLTSRDYNRASSVMLVSPITRTRREWPFNVALTVSDPVAGYVVADQVRVVDPMVRRFKYAGKVSDKTLDTVRAILASLFGIPVSR